jgi:CobQ-like glutamine amidotransferase family enzyme
MFRDLVSTDTSVVVASRTKEGLARTDKLGVVPYGEGQVTLKREDGAQTAEVIEHYFRGPITTRKVAVEGGMLRLPLRERSENGFVEWIEVNI